MNYTKSFYRHVSLNAIRIFKVVADLGSFKLASEALYLTPSAISQQIKKLETSLGILLFSRQSKGVRLTPAGMDYLEKIRPALLLLEQSTEQIFEQYSQNHLRISLIPPIAYRIVFPHLAEFQKLYPFLKLSFDVSEKNIDFAYSQFDLAIRFDHPPWINCDHEHLLDIQIQAICNQHVFEAFNLAKDPKNICSAPLLHMTNTPEAWGQFIVGLQLGEVGESGAGIEVNDYQNAIEAVINYGVALALYPLEKPYVVEKDLVEIPDLNVPFKQIYAVTVKGRLQDSSIQLFLNWLKTKLRLAD